VPGHDTPHKLGEDAPGGSGTESIDQRVPSQRSTNALVPLEAVWMPTATQLVALAHDTEERLLNKAASDGLWTIDQRVPSHRSTNVFADDVPTAKQLVALAHDTPERLLESALRRLELETIDHRVPSHRSTSVSLPIEADAVPTAKHLVAVEHDTPERLLERAPRGFGLATIDQRAPSHRSTNVFVDDAPTAKQLVAVEHDTPEKLLRDARVVRGPSTIDHLAPSQCSAKVLTSPAATSDFE
jgi:hypothetical protein